MKTKSYGHLAPRCGALNTVVSPLYTSERSLQICNTQQQLVTTSIEAVIATSWSGNTPRQPICAKLARLEDAPTNLMAAHITQKLNENTTPHLCFLPKQTSLVVSGWKSPNRFELENKTSKQSHCYVFRKMKRNKKVAAETQSMHVKDRTSIWLSGTNVLATLVRRTEWEAWQNPTGRSNADRNGTNRTGPESWLIRCAARTSVCNAEKRNTSSAKARTDRGLDWLLDGHFRHFALGVFCVKKIEK